MTIRSGEDWGSDVEGVPPDAVISTSDVFTAQCVARGLQVVVRGGSLHDALGGPSGTPSRVLPVDLVTIEDASGATVVQTIGTLTVRRSYSLGGLWGRVVIVSNTGHLDRYTPCPAAHPNDGMFDVLEADASMSLRQRLVARRRAQAGAHLPHPLLRVTRHTEYAFEVHAGERLVCERGVVVGPGRFRAVIEIDAGNVFV